MIRRRAKRQPLAHVMIALTLVVLTWCNVVDLAVADVRPDCQSEGVQVTSADAGDAQIVCTALAEIRAYFAAIGFHFNPAVSVVFRNPESAESKAISRAHGYFDPRQATIVLFRSPDTAPWTLAWQPALATSFLKHELVHLSVLRILQTNNGLLRPEWHEFIAYAVQFDLMPDKLRAQVLSQYRDVKPFTELTQVNEFTYGMQPERFAVAAYKTYRIRGGQSFIKQLFSLELKPAPFSYPFPVLPEQRSSP